jgi:hypothetical protein
VQNQVQIKENHWLAKIAAKKLQSPSIALVLGNTIYLYGVTAADFWQNTAWVKHELQHVQQYKQLGILPFLLKYGWYSIRYGYTHNPLEIEARQAEKQ